MLPYRSFAHPIIGPDARMGGSATDAAALPSRHIAAQGPLCLWATHTLINTRQGRCFAQAAVKLCGLLEQRRDLGTCPTLTSLNAALVACRASGSMALSPPCLRATSHRGSTNATLFRSKLGMLLWHAAQIAKAALEGLQICCLHTKWNMTIESREKRYA
jgi:hypothetical protein